MAKLRTHPIDSEAIESFLKTNDEFAFEITCKRELEKRDGLKIAHAGTYDDPITNKARQFDFRIEFAPNPALRIAVALECKNLGKNFPLLISRIPRDITESFHQLLIPGERYDDSTAGIAANIFESSAEFRVDAPNSPYQPGEMVGKATTQVGKNLQGDFHSDDSEVYDKWAQAVSSAHGLISDANSAFSDDKDLQVAFFILPVVVVPDGTLWIKDYHNDGEVDVAALVDETSFYLNQAQWCRGQTFSYTISHLHFVTLTGLGSLIDRHLVNGNFHDLLLPPS